MRLHRYRTSLGFAAAIPQIANEFLTRIELCARRLVSIEIAHETNAERDVVQIIAVHVTPVDLTPPPIPHFDLAVACGSAVANDKMVRKTILHPPDVPMIIIKSARVSLSRAAVVHDNELPATPFHWRAPDAFDD